MSTFVELQESQTAFVAPESRPLDEAVWQAWAEKGRAQDRRSSAARVKAVKWVSIAVLLAAAGLWSHFAPYEVVVRCIVTAGALAMMFDAFHARRYAFAAVFGALALLYNPLGSFLTFSGGWQRAVVASSAVPFVASLAWRNVRTAHNA